MAHADTICVSGGKKKVLRHNKDAVLPRRFAIFSSSCWKSEKIQVGAPASLMSLRHQRQDKIVSLPPGRHRGKHICFPLQVSHSSGLINPLPWFNGIVLRWHGGVAVTKMVEVQSVNIDWFPGFSRRSCSYLAWEACAKSNIWDAKLRDSNRSLRVCVWESACVCVCGCVWYPA